MKKVPYLKILLWAFLLLWARPSWAATVQAEVIHSQDRYQAGGRYPLLFRLTVLKPWNIHGTKQEKGFVPTTLSFPDHPELRVEDVRFPNPRSKKLDFSPDPMDVFSGDLLVHANLVVKGDAGEGDRTIQGTLSFQACSDRVCLQPEQVPIPVSLTISPSSTKARMLNQALFARQIQQGPAESVPFKVIAGTGLWLTLLGLFLGGLALNLTPCIYPLIPITVSYFSGKSTRFKGRPLFHALLYITGLAVTNSLLGVSAALSGGLLGSVLQHPLALIGVSAVLILLGLSFFGLWELRLPARLSRAASRNYGGLPGTFFMGLTLGVVAAPCLGPFLLGLLTYVGQKGDPYLGFLYFFTLSIGMGLPLSVLAFFSGAVDRLPLSGDWMLWIRKLMGWVMIGMAGYVISPLIPREAGRSLLLVCLAVAAAVHLGWIDRSGKGHRPFVLFKRGLGLFLIGAAVLFVFFPGSGSGEIRWIPYDQDRISIAAEDKIPLMLDFYADWCTPCKAMDKEVFTDPEVVQLSRRLIAMRVDLTRRRPLQDEILRRYRVRGVPTLIFFNRKGIEERGLRIESYAGKAEVLARMRALLENSPSFQE